VSFIIVEGGDGTGKTTLAEELAETYGAEYEHVGPPRTDMTPFAEHIEYAFVLSEQYGSVVFDRFHLGCFAYGPIWRPENDIDGIGDFRRADWELFEHLISSRCLLVMCDPGWQVVEANLSGRDGTQPLAEFESDPAKVTAVYDRFRKAYEFSILDKIMYDYNDPTSRDRLTFKVEEVLGWMPVSSIRPR
jgi:thymidylate kinase